MSKDKSKKWVISAPLFYNYASFFKIFCGSFFKIFCGIITPEQDKEGLLKNAV
ncbi:MAG: hypothetical protein MR469_05430 [Campylobacter sp.]|uniref:hypothetical protein n=1 Tax=Campylobacter sp. TaxID=205 RepID=UPI002AA7A64A|nr:hypothetical protein [Campylobacter sp.]MCI6695068.1 hypothetical protein [Campylobacter sp.]